MYPRISLIRFRIVQGKPGAFLAHTLGVGDGLGVGEDGADPDVLPEGSAAECWLAGVNILQPDTAIATKSEPETTGSHARRRVRAADECMPDRIRAPGRWVVNPRAPSGAPVVNS